MMRSTLFLIVVLAALFPTGDRRAPYRTGTVINVRTEEIAERSPGSVQSAIDETGAAKQPAPATVDIMSIRSGTATYVARRVDRDEQPCHPQQFGGGQHVRFRLLGRDLYLKCPHGGEIRFIYAVAGNGRSEKPPSH